jgi:uncharacterized protein (DUF924 family)
MTPRSMPEDVVGFWRDAGPGKWFATDQAFDAEFERRFRDAHFAAARRELDDWADAAESGLALLLLLDQFPRNVFRGTGHAFATDPLARHFARRFVDAGLDAQVEPDLRRFCYLPFQHSEAMEDQDRAVALMQALGDPKWALHHRDIIRRFGRFPHRNAALGREGTPEERAFLREGGFGG